MYIYIAWLLQCKEENLTKPLLLSKSSDKFEPKYKFLIF